MDIIDIKLISGEEYLAELVEDTDEVYAVRHCVSVHEDVSLNAANGMPSNREKVMSLSPILALGDFEQVLAINKRLVVTAGKPTDGMIKMMEDKFGKEEGKILTPNHGGIKTGSSEILLS